MEALVLSHSWKKNEEEHIGKYHLFLVHGVSSCSALQQGFRLVIKAAMSFGS